MSKFKDKERIWKAQKKQLVTYKETLIRLSGDFSAETQPARIEGHNIVKLAKRKKCPEHSTQQSSELKNWCFPNKQKLIHYTGLAADVKGISLSWKENVLISKKKHMKA